jgi:glycosyltransferase involved in cell wall biosynthesis
MPTGVTVVTVTRNDLDGLKRTVQSVRDQLSVEIQHIVVDGASTDGTAAWLATQPWLPGSGYISESDQGIYDAMNKGARKAEQELLVFLNGGDVFHALTTARDMVGSYETQQWKWAYGVTALIQNDGTVSRIHQMAPFSRVRLGLGLAAVPHQAMWLQTSFFRDLGGFRISAGLSADMDLCWRACNETDPFLVNEILCDAEEGGISAHQPPGYYARAMRKNVKASGSSVLGSPVLDPIAAASATGLTAFAQLIPAWWSKRNA